MVVQFFGAFNDNLLKTLVSLLIVIWVHNAQMRDQLVYLSGVVFVAPFLIFSMVAGRLADRIGKPRVILGVQVWQLVVVLVAIVSLLAQHIPWMMGALFLLSMQAAFFSPAKYGILPELMDDHELSNANGLFNTGTFAAILLGTVAGSFLALRLGWACGLLIAASVVGLVSSLTLMPLPAAKPDEPWAWNPLTDLISNWRLIRQNRSLKLGIIAVNYFWFFGAILQLNIFLYAKDMMNAGPRFSGLLLIAATIGIGLGSFLAGKFSGRHLELGWVPVGALGMSLFAIALCWAYHSRGWTLFHLFMLGASGGFYEVPLNSFVQWHSPKGERGRILATVNFFSFMAILGASGALYVMGTLLRLDPAQIFGAVGFVSLAGMAVIVFRTKESRRYFVGQRLFP
jgi:acyl-[acyl-carrier-protein]-phospholipid O-acyltransferase / long-chain-fatty-acid--[acyl-carrier-protein] ligase